MTKEQVPDRVQSRQRDFEALLSQVTSAIAGRPLDSELEASLNRSFPPAAGLVHRPTVSGGEALVLYLLPNGAIEFTQS